MLEDGYPDGHPAPYDFEGMLILFLYREITDESPPARSDYVKRSIGRGSAPKLPRIPEIGPVIAYPPKLWGITHVFGM
jgi:hypothetical protein